MAYRRWDGSSPIAISHQPSAISHQPSAISHQPSAISHQPWQGSYSRVPRRHTDAGNSGRPTRVPPLQPVDRTAFGGRVSRRETSARSLLLSTRDRSPRRAARSRTLNQEIPGGTVSGRRALVVIAALWTAFAAIGTARVATFDLRGTVLAG